MASTSVDCAARGSGGAPRPSFRGFKSLCDSRKGARASKRKSRWVCRAERPSRVRSASQLWSRTCSSPGESADLSANSAERILQASSAIKARRSDVAINSHGGLFSAAETPPVERRFFNLAI